MKSKVQWDPEITGKARRWYWPIRSIGNLMIVVALVGPDALDCADGGDGMSGVGVSERSC